MPPFCLCSLKATAVSAKQLKLKSPVHLAKALEEEEGNHRFEPASLLLVNALQYLCRVQGSYRKTESCLQPVYGQGHDGASHWQTGCTLPTLILISSSLIGPVTHRHQQLDLLHCLLGQSVAGEAGIMNSSFGARCSTRQIGQKSHDQFDIDVVLSFFQLQGCKAIWLQLLNDPSHKMYLATVGDACLRFFVLRELALRGLKTSGQLCCSSQRCLTNSQLAILGSKLHLSAVLGHAGKEPPSERTLATTVEALVGAGEMHLSGANTQGVVLSIMHFLDNCGETSAVKCCHRYPYASTLVK